MTTLDLSSILLTAVYVAAGFMHFVLPKMYLKIMPPWLPYPALLNRICGFAEIGLGLLVQVPQMRSLAAWGLIALLLAIFPANLHMFHMGFKRTGIPNWILLLRLPFQAVLIYWAYRVGISVA